jgi:hypothetical protein
MNTPRVLRVGRSVLGLIAVTLSMILSVGTAPVEAAPTVEWTYQASPPAPTTWFTGLQFQVDGSGGVAAIVQETDATTGTPIDRRLIWLDRHGVVLVNQSVGLNGELAYASRKTVYVTGVYDESTYEMKLMVARRNGVINYVTGTWGDVGQSELGIVDTYSSQPFAEGGFFMFFYSAQAGDPDYLLPQVLTIRSYTAD